MNGTGASAPNAAACDSGSGCGCCWSCSSSASCSSASSATADVPSHEGKKPTGLSGVPFRAQVLHTVISSTETRTQGITRILYRAASSGYFVQAVASTK